MEDKYLKTKEKLKKYNQEHLLKFYDELNDKEKENLLEDILDINFEQITTLFNEIKKEDNVINSLIEPIQYIDKEKMSEEDKNYYNKIGTKCIEDNEYAVVTMAGGQRNKTWA